MRHVSPGLFHRGPDRAPPGLGALHDAAFRALLEKFVGLPPVKLKEPLDDKTDWPGALIGVDFSADCRAVGRGLGTEEGVP